MAYDLYKEYDTKSIAELISIREQFEKAILKRPNGTFNEHLQFVKMKIAEHIGRKKK